MIARMMGLVVAAWIIALSMGGEARAWTFFGTVEDIHPLQDVTLKGPDSEALFIGYKTSTIYFIGGLTVGDDGYVLGLQADHTRFLDMPKDETLAKFQADGLLPSPLPPYSLGLADYIRGYSLWLIVAVVIGLYFLIWMLRRRFSPLDY